MSRLHKKSVLNLAQKTEIFFLLLILYGVYKNGFLPYYHHYYSLGHIFLIILYPLTGFLIGCLFDYLFPKKVMFSHKFYGVFLSLCLPISTPIWLFITFLAILFLFDIFFVQKKDLDFHYLVLGKLLLVLALFYLNRYDYANSLESSGRFIYTFFDGLIGHQVSGMFSSSFLLIVIAFLVFCFDTYYKKEIPLYSYGVYFITLIGYSVYQGNMLLFLENFTSSSILFALVFMAPFPLFSPYSSKRKAFYGGLIGILILPCSIYTNFYEGVYVAILIANICILFLNFLQNKLRRKVK